MSDPLRPSADSISKELLRLTRRVVTLERAHERLMGRLADTQGQLLQARRFLRQFVSDVTPPEPNYPISGPEDLP